MDRRGYASKGAGERAISEWGGKPGDSWDYGCQDRKRLKEGQPSISLKADAKSREMKTKSVPLGLSTRRLLEVLITTVAAERREWKPGWIVSWREWA